MKVRGSKSLTVRQPSSFPSPVEKERRPNALAGAQQSRRNDE